MLILGVGIIILIASALIDVYYFDETKARALKSTYGVGSTFTVVFPLRYGKVKR